MGFFTDQAKPALPPTLEEENEGKVPRDRHDRPMIWLPDGSKRAPYARASSYGGQIEDKFNLQLWEMRQVLRGCAIDPTIPQRVPEIAKDRAKQSEDFSKKDKDAMNALVEQAKEAAGSNDKSGLGTAIHAATEFIDRGESLDGLSELLVDRANAYYKATTEAGLRHNSIETFGVEDLNEVAGTWDRSSSATWFGGKNRIADVKTSGSMHFAGIGFMVQLAEYAHMQAYELDGTRTPHENMDLDVAVIIHVDRNMGGPVEIYEVDIARGWEYAHLARQIILSRRVAATRGAFVEIPAEAAAIRSCSTREELLELWEAFGDEAKSWTAEFKARGEEIAS
jgi:hypothetical protein